MALIFSMGDIINVHWFDWATVLIVVLFCLRGLRRGLILQLSALVAVALGLLGGLYLHSAVMLLLPDLGHPVVQFVAGFTLAFVGVALGVNILARLLKTAVDALFLGTVDRILGAILGVVVAMLLVIAVVLLVSRFLPGGVEWLAATRTAGIVYTMLDLLLPLLPSHFDQFFRDAAVNWSGPDELAPIGQDLLHRYDGLLEQGRRVLKESAAAAQDAL